MFIFQASPAAVAAAGRNESRVLLVPRDAVDRVGAVLAVALNDLALAQIPDEGSVASRGRHHAVEVGRRPRQTIDDSFVARRCVHLSSDAASYKADETREQRWITHCSHRVHIPDLYAPVEARSGQVLGTLRLELAVENRLDVTLKKVN